MPTKKVFIPGSGWHEVKVPVKKEKDPEKVKRFKEHVNESTTTLKDKIRHHVFAAWKEDGLTHTPENHHRELEGDDLDDFEDHVDDVHKHMKKHNIKDPEKGTHHYMETLANAQDAAHKKTRH